MSTVGFGVSYIKYMFTLFLWISVCIGIGVSVNIQGQAGTSETYVKNWWRKQSWEHTYTHTLRHTKSGSVIICYVMFSEKEEHY